jgi:hypothetical protein
MRHGNIVELVVSCNIICGTECGYSYSRIAYCVVVDAIVRCASVITILWIIKEYSPSYGSYDVTISFIARRLGEAYSNELVINCVIASNRVVSIPREKDPSSRVIVYLVVLKDDVVAVK